VRHLRHRPVHLRRHHSFDEEGDVLGHENMGGGRVGPENKPKVAIAWSCRYDACGECFLPQWVSFRMRTTNPDHADAAKPWGNSPAGLLAIRTSGGYAGGQADICACRTPCRSD
jgi:hypothetical protein